MLKPKNLGKKIFVLAALGLLAFLASNVQAAESSCVTCHLDKEMLKKNITASKGAKSAMQSGAG